MHPGKHVEASNQENIFCDIYRCFPANIRLGEDVLKTSSALTFFVFKDVLKRSSRHLQDIVARRLLEDVFKTSCRYVLKTSWTRLCKRSCKHVLKTFWRRLKDALEDEKLLRRRRLQDVFKTSWKTRNVCWVITTGGYKTK